ncbi:MAG: hypothetical protein ACYDBH_01815 [Acidobacteriaceae bacterium]
MTNKAGLADLAQNYPPGSRGLGILVLREYAQITSARRHGWSWADIAQAMDLDAKKAKPLAEAYRRVTQRIASGQLTAPPARGVPAPRPSAEATRERLQRPPPGAAVKTPEQNAAALAASGVTVID